MATRVRYHQLTLCPTPLREPPQADPEAGSRPEGQEWQMPDFTEVIPHIENGWCQVAGAEFIGGGSKARFLVHLLVFEPVADNE